MATEEQIPAIVSSLESFEERGREAKEKRRNLLLKLEEGAKSLTKEERALLVGLLS